MQSHGSHADNRASSYYLGPDNKGVKEKEIISTFQTKVQIFTQSFVLVWLKLLMTDQRKHMISWRPVCDHMLSKWSIHCASPLFGLCSCAAVVCTDRAWQLWHYFYSPWQMAKVGAHILPPSLLETTLSAPFFNHLKAGCHAATGGHCEDCLMPLCKQFFHFLSGFKCLDESVCTYFRVETSR